MGHGEEKENASTRKLAMLICGEELHLLVSKEISVEVEHVKAHRTKEGQERDVEL